MEDMVGVRTVIHQAASFFLIRQQCISVHPATCLQLHRTYNTGILGVKFKVISCTSSFKLLQKKTGLFYLLVRVVKR